jgi:LAS superfamily LD-carboxypeptidase LdcB
MATKKAPATTVYPVLPIIMPTDLKGQKNGYLATPVLRSIQKPSGYLEKHAATAWNCLQLAAYFNHLTLNQSGAYRRYSQQLALFNARYSTTDMGRKPQVTRIWQGKKYYLKPGMSPCASPGQSDHGWGLAIDAANCTTGSPLLAWLLGDSFATCEALKYGFTWAVADPKNPNFEPWHLQFVTGDSWTPAVLEMLKVFPALEA